MTGIPNRIGLLLIGVYWFAMVGLVVNNFTRTNNEEVTYSSLVPRLHVNNGTSYLYSSTSHLPAPHDEQ